MGIYKSIVNDDCEEIAITPVIEGKIKIGINWESIELNKSEAISLLKSLQKNIKDFE